MKIVFICNFFILISLQAFVASKDVTTYEQIGDGFMSKIAVNEYSGGIHLSGNGKVIAIGSPASGENDEGEVKVYRSIGFGNLTTWELFGSWSGTAERQAQGVSVSLSNNGYHLAIGSLMEDKRGSVQIYTYRQKRESWELFDTINGTNALDQFGTKIDLSSGKGKILAIGSDPVTDAEYYPARPPYVKIYGCWKQQDEKCQEIENFNNTVYDQVALSADGNTVIVGSSSSDSNEGRVALYSRDDIALNYTKSDNFTTLMQSLEPAENGILGFAVAINSDATTIAFSAPGESCINPKNASQTLELCGVVRIYSIDGGTFTQLGGAITGRADDYLLGKTIDFSNDGRTIIVSSSSKQTVAMSTIYSYNENSEWQKQGRIRGDHTFRGMERRIDGVISGNAGRVLFLSPGASTDVNVAKVYFQRIGPPVENICSNKPGYRLKRDRFPAKEKPCFWIGKRKGRQQNFCEGEVAEKCKRSCGLC